MPGWTLTWSDEFDAPDIPGGALVITATTDNASSYQCSYPTAGPCQYTGARLLTKGTFTQKYGRFEARIKIPAGQGRWPAFWLLGANIDSVGWRSAVNGRARPTRPRRSPRTMQVDCVRVYTPAP